MIQEIAPYHYHVEFQRVAPKDTDIFLAYDRGQVLVQSVNEAICFPTVEQIREYTELTTEEFLYLFTIEDTAYFSSGKEVSEFLAFRYVEKQKIREFEPMYTAFAAITGMQIAEFYKQQRYCCVCGGSMKQHEKERALVCHDCGRIVYPTISPCVIVGVIHQDKILLTKYASSHSSYKKYALIAGFVEVGETLEDTVKREVMEEVGLRVKHITYYKSQPWSFTNTLLMGFFCELDGSEEIHMDREELSKAEWRKRSDMPDRSSEKKISLTGEMMDVFEQGHIESIL